MIEQNFPTNFFNKFTRKVSCNMKVYSSECFQIDQLLVILFKTNILSGKACLQSK